MVKKPLSELKLLQPFPIGLIAALRQTAFVVNDTRALPQGDGGIWQALARGASSTPAKCFSGNWKWLYQGSPKSHLLEEFAFPASAA